MTQRRLTTEEMIAVMYDRSERMEHAVFGNGQPGLIDRVARTEERLDSRDRTVAKTSGVTAVITAVLTAVLGWLSGLR